MYLNYWACTCRVILGGILKRLYFLRASKKANLPAEVSLATSFTNIHPSLEYASPIWEISQNTLMRTYGDSRTAAWTLLAFPKKHWTSLLRIMTTVADVLWTIIRISILLDPRTCVFQFPEQRDIRTRLSLGVQTLQPGLIWMIIYLAYILAWSFNV